MGSHNVPMGSKSWIETSVKTYMFVFVFTIRVTCPANRNHIHVTTLTILRKGAGRNFLVVGAHYLHVKWPHFEITNNVAVI